MREWVLASKGWRRVDGARDVLEPADPRAIAAARLALAALERLEAAEDAQRREAARARRAARKDGR